jgi:hypothetical protein
MADDVARLRANHRGAVRAKRQTEKRLKIALGALQHAYTVCCDNAQESCEHRMALDFVRQVVGDGFERATSPITPSQSGNSAAISPRIRQ